MWSGRGWAALIAAAGLLGLVACTETAGPGMAELGRRLYEQGLQADGSPLRALRPEGIELVGQYAACVTCHRRSGMGSIEGSIDSTVLVPPVAGPLLFAPARFHGLYLDRYHHWVPNERWARALKRGAYDEATLARALRDGVDPDGSPLHAPMPRYELGDDEIAALAAYLRTLAAAPTPGVEETELHLATIVSPEADPEEAERVLGVLRAWSDSSRASGHTWRLHEWRLDGPADGWRAQLETRYRERPVFAVLSGSGATDWAPVHAFCEQRRVPCVLPALTIAPDADGYYSVYFSPGLALEARILARSLADRPSSDSRIVQVFGDESGARAARTLSEALPEGTDGTSERRHRWTAPGAALSGISQDDTLVLWLRSGAVEAIAASAPQAPPAGRVFLSALLAPPEATTLPGGWRDRVFWVSLFDDLGVQGQIARIRLREWLARYGLPTPASLRAEADAYAAAYLVHAALAEIVQQEVRRPAVPLGRDHLLETIETLANKYSDGTELVDRNSHVAFYGRMSLGPGQRTAVRGGILVRYPSHDSKRLVAASERIVP